MVDIVTWRSDAREIPDADVSEFYDAPLPELTLFRYAVRRFALDPHRTHFSLKVTLKGREEYAFGRRRFSLAPGAVLFANDGETHASEVRDEAEALSIYVPGADAAAMAGAALSSIYDELDAPADSSVPPDLAQAPIAMSAATLAACDALSQSLSYTDKEGVTLAASTFVQHAVADACRAAPPSALRDVQRRSARDELVARVLRAKAIIDDCGGAGYDLDALAREACLSRYHLLRRFADVVGEPPGAYARRRRLEAARAALARGEEIGRVARRAGYRSVRRFRDACARVFDTH